MVGVGREERGQRAVRGAFAALVLARCARLGPAAHSSPILLLVFIIIILGEREREGEKFSLQLEDFLGIFPGEGRIFRRFLLE